jgi:hypothetical protein
MDITAPGEKLLKKLTSGHGPIVIEIHAGHSIKKIIDRTTGHFEMIGQNSGKIFLVKGGFDAELGVIKDDIVKLDNGIHNGPIPVLTTGFDHPVGETVQGNIKDMTLPFEPGSQAAKAMVMFNQQDSMAGIGQTIGGGKPTQTGTDHHYIVGAGGFINRIIGHNYLSLKICLFTMVTPESMAPTIPRYP